MNIWRNLEAGYHVVEGEVFAIKILKTRESQPCKRTGFWHNGERKRCESAWTWTCSCGAEECGSTKAIALDAWRSHKQHSDKRNHLKNKNISPLTESQFRKAWDEGESLSPIKEGGGS